MVKEWQQLIRAATPDPESWEARVRRWSFNREYEQRILASATRAEPGTDAWGLFGTPYTVNPSQVPLAIGYDGKGETVVFFLEADGQVMVVPVPKFEPDLFPFPQFPPPSLETSMRWGIVAPGPSQAWLAGLFEADIRANITSIIETPHAARWRKPRHRNNHPNAPKRFRGRFRR